jgi:hypothetical protein
VLCTVRTLSASKRQLRTLNSAARRNCSGPRTTRASITSFGANRGPASDRSVRGGAWWEENRRSLKHFGARLDHCAGPSAASVEADVCAGTCQGNIQSDTIGAKRTKRLGFDRPTAQPRSGCVDSYRLPLSFRLRLDTLRSSWTGLGRRNPPPQLTSCAFPQSDKIERCYDDDEPH